MQNWEVLGKSFINISNVYSNNKELARLKLHILGTGYLKKVSLRFIKISTKNNNEVEADAKNLEPVSNSKDEKNKQNLRKE